MKPLGYVLIVLNILAGGAFVYFATVDWSERQKWTYANFRHEVAIAGLPVEQPATYEYEGDQDKVTFRFEYQNPGSKDWITTVARDEIFKAGGTKIDGGPIFNWPAVTSQEQEVQELQKLVNVKLGEQPDAQSQLGLLKSALLRLANSNTERDAVYALNDVGTAQDLLNAYFDAALADTTADGGQISEDKKRDRIATLLFNVGDGLIAHLSQAAQGAGISAGQQAWQSRVVTVVGLEEYVSVVAARASSLDEIAGRLQIRLKDRKALFLKKYRPLVEQSRSLSKRLDKIEQQIVKDELERDENRALRDARQAEFNDLSAAFGIAQSTAYDTLEKQNEKEQQLFQTEAQLGAALAAIADLEGELRRLELGDK